MNFEDLDCLVEGIYDAALDSDLWPSVLAGISEAVGGVGGLILPIAGEEGMRLICTPNIADGVAIYERDWWRLDSRNHAVNRRRITGLISDPDLFTEAEMSRDPFYQEFLRPCGLGHFACYNSSPLPGQSISLSIQRDIRKGAFGTSEKERLLHLGRHAARALSVATKIRSKNRVSDALASTVDQVACGVILLDDRGTVIFASQPAERLLGDALIIRHRRLCAVVPGSQRELDRLVASAFPGSAVSTMGSMALPSRGLGASLIVQAIPVKPQTADRLERLILGSGGVLVLIQDVTPRMNASIEQFLVQLGLTHGQARIAEAIGQGHPTREVAKQLGITEHTVRHVLKTVFAKLNISRQIELAIIVSKLTGIM